MNGDSLNLAAFGSVDNAGYGCIGVTAQENVSATTGETEIHDVGYATPATELQSEWVLNDTNIGWSWTTLANDGGNVAEIRAATGAGVAGFLPLMGVGN